MYLNNLKDGVGLNDYASLFLFIKIKINKNTTHTEILIYIFKNLAWILKKFNGDGAGGWSPGHPNFLV